MEQNFVMLLAGIVGVVIVGVAYLIHRGKLERLNDPTVVYADQLPNSVVLNKDGAYVVEIYRQSGSLYHDPVEYSCPHEALKAIQRTLHKARIKTVKIVQNSETAVEAQRALQSFCGKKSRKVGGFKIYARG